MYVCVSPLLWITSMYALHVCVLYVRPGVSGVSWCVSFIVWVRLCVCGLLQLSVCTTPGIAMVYYCVLMHGRMGNVWVLVCGMTVCVVKLSTSTVGVSDAQLASTGDVAQCTQCTFPVVDIWYYLVSVYDFSWVYMFVTCFLHAVYLCFTGKLFSEG